MGAQCSDDDRSSTEARGGDDARRKEYAAALERAAQRDARDWEGPSGPVCTVGNDDVTISVTPHDAGRISSIKAFGHELLLQYEPGMKVFRYGAFPMTPWVGRVGAGLLYSQGLTYQLPMNRPPYSMHGLGRLEKWSVVEQSANSVTVRFDLSAWWPWKAYSDLEISVAGTSAQITQTVVSQEAGLQESDARGADSHAAAFPAQLGLHPWFRRHLAPRDSDAPVRIDFAPDWQAEKGGNGLPTGRRITPLKGPWDDTFGWDSTMNSTMNLPMTAGLVWDDVELRIAADCSYGTVFNELEPAVCVEPQTSVPNALDAEPGQHMVRPGEPLVLTTNLSFATSR
jgi:galactose mutarotase-like enzyme